MILNGKKVSGEILADISIKIKEKINSGKRKPKIAIVLIGENSASKSYVKAKSKACDKAYIDHKIIRLENDISEVKLLSLIEKLNQDNAIDGFIVQLPLPSHINKDMIINAINPEKDIDGFHPVNFGKMSLGQKSMRPATAYGILKLIEYYKIETCGKHVVVVGRSNIVGKPVSIMLGNDFNIGRATVTTCDINTPKSLLVEQTKKADIIIVAVGKPGLLTTDMVNTDSIIIDVGINRLKTGKLVGDCDFEGLSKKVKMITPVPGGVGPMTITGLILNTYETWKNSETN